MALLLLAVCSAPVSAARARGDAGPARDLSITTSAGVVHSENEPFATGLDLTTLARLRWFMAGGTLQAATTVLAINLGSAALHAGYGWRSRNLDAKDMGGPYIGGCALRASVLGTFGVRHYRYDNWMDDYDPGTSATLPFVGARAGISVATKTNHRSHFLLGLTFTVDANLGATTRRYDYLADGEPDHGEMKVGGLRWGVLLDLGVLRDLR